MFGFGKRKVDADNLAAELFRSVVQAPHITELAKSLYKRVGDQIELDYSRFESEFLCLRMFAADYGLALASTRNEGFRAVREIFNALIILPAKGNPKEADILNFFNNRFEAYGRATNHPHHLGPAYMIGSAFVDFCQRNKFDPNSPKDILFVTHAAGQFTAVVTATSDILNSVKVRSLTTSSPPTSKIQGIAAGFKTLREEQFDSATRVLERRLGRELTILRKPLGGDADRALRGYQLWITTVFVAVHPYVPQEESQSFFRSLSSAVCRDDVERVLSYYQEFHQCRHDVAEQMARVAFPVVNYLTVQPHPMATTLVARLMPIYVCNTQMVISDTFGDLATINQLESEMENIRRELTRS